MNKIGQEIGEISRGLYGDEKNDQEGLIQRQGQDETNFERLDARVKRVEQQQYKTGVWLGIGSAVLVAIIEYFKSWK